jgi:hypothetical protein
MSFSDVLQLAKIGMRDAAAILLKEEFGKLQSPEQRVNLCKWIASCFEGLEEYGSAAEWYEMTGLLSLGEYEKARAYYTMCEDDEKVELCSSVIDQLNKCFVAS